eukprot:1140718-Pelagomonas_calceolata.AAC.8
MEGMWSANSPSSMDGIPERLPASSKGGSEGRRSMLRQTCHGSHSENDTAVDAAVTPDKQRGCHPCQRLTGRVG